MATLHVDSSDGDHSNGSSNNSGNLTSSLVYEVHLGTLLHLLTNSLVLAHTAPYLSAYDVLRLAATSKAYRALIYGTPSVFRYLDLSRLESAARLGDDYGVVAAYDEPIDRGGQTWRNEQIDENLTEDEFYSGPLRGAFRALSRPSSIKSLEGLGGPAGGRWLAGVHTLILNNVSVTAELVHEILRSPDYNVRILSLRNAKHCNEVQLRQILRTVCRASRPDGTPKLRGLYVFGGETGWDNAVGGYHQQPSSGTAAASANASRSRDHQPNGDDLWYRSRGRVLSRQTASAEWAGTLMDCRGVLAFDGVLCNGPRHANSPAFGKVRGLMSGGSGGGSGGGVGGRVSPNHRPPASPPHTTFAMAHLALDGCASCGCAPEGWTTWGDEASSDDAGDGYLSQFPLLWPPPLLSSNVRVAMCPEGESPHPNRFAPSGHTSGHTHAYGDDSTATNDKAPLSRFIARCEWCAYGRLCAVCHRWWCEACMPDQENAVPWTWTATPAGTGVPGSSSSSSHKTLIDYSCRECGPSCHDCLAKTQRRCKRCRQGYCIMHNLGSSMTHQPRVSLKSHY